MANAGVKFNAEMWLTCLRCAFSEPGITFGDVGPLPEDSQNGEVFAFMVDDLGATQTDPAVMMTLLRRPKVAMCHALQAARDRLQTPMLCCEIREIEWIHNTATDAWVVKALMVYEPT
jgi:hypothetical protein